MHLDKSEKSSSVDGTLGIIFAAFLTFVVGYTASRVFLSGKVVNNSASENLTVTPHQSTLWDSLGRSSVD